MRTTNLFQSAIDAASIRELFCYFALCCSYWLKCKTFFITNLNSKNGIQINKVQILDINGRVVNEINPSNVSEIQINISELNAGVYFVKAQSENGVGTTKIVKQ